MANFSICCHLSQKPVKKIDWDNVSDKADKLEEGLKLIDWYRQNKTWPKGLYTNTNFPTTSTSKFRPIPEEDARIYESVHALPQIQGVVFVVGLVCDDLF